MGGEPWNVCTPAFITHIITSLEEPSLQIRTPSSRRDNFVLSEHLDKFGGD